MPATITAALIREQGVTFAVVAVKPDVLADRSAADALIAAAASQVFPGHVVALMAQRFDRPEYYGRRDIARFLASIDPRRIPWRRWQINQ